MRSYTLTLAQNTGDGTLGNTLDLSSRISDLGSIKWEVDEQLTKLSPGDFAPSILDDDGTVWSWLQTQTPVSGALYPPFLVLDIDGMRAFTGIVKPENAIRDQKTGVVTLTAQDWSVMLASQALDTWVRPSPRAVSDRKAGEARTCWLWWCRGSQGFSGRCYLFGSGAGWPGAPIWTSPNPDCIGLPGEANNWLEIGDQVTCEALPGKVYKVVGLFGWDAQSDGQLVAAHTGNGTGGYTVQLSPPGFTKAYCDATGAALNTIGDPDSRWQFTLTRLARDTESRTYYSVTKAVGHDDKNPCYALPLDTVDGVVPGDVLRVINSASSQSWTVLQVDAAGLEAITREEVRDLAVNDRIFFSEDCAKEVVFEDARSVVRRACEPFSCDLSRYTPPTLPVPVLCWLPLRPLTGADLTSVRDMDQGFGTLRVYGSGPLAWDGTPEAGWAMASGSLPRAHWTDQTLAAPASLMPDETATLSPKTPRRYRPTNLRWRSRSWDLEDVRPDPDPDPWNPETIPSVVLYDYLQMRRVQIAGTSVVINAWSGSAWGANVTASWPDAATVKSACLLPGGPDGMVVGLTANGLVGAVVPSLSTKTSVLAVPASASDAVLRTTPWGAYLVGSRGYGRITYASGTLSLAWVDLIAAGAGNLYPNTFAGIDRTHVMALARFDSLDSQGKTVTETHVILLQPSPSTAAESLIWDEKILDGAAVTLGAMRDPSQVGRVIGHCGGRIFQVSATLPTAYALERFTPSSMNSAELLEHVCQVLQAVAVPTAGGVMQIISRSSISAPQALTVDQVEVTDTRAWEHFYSLVRVTGASDDLLYDATGPICGGQLLEVSQHPLIWSISGCAAMAESLAAWFGRPRRLQEQTWFWTDPQAAAPWEGLQALQPLVINGDAVTRMLTSLEYWPDKGEATSTLVEV